MFILYALLVGLVIGLILGGKPQRLGGLSFRLPYVMAAGLVVQIALFAEPVAERIGDLGPAIYVGSTVAVWLAVAMNIGLPGIPLVVVGAASNLIAILANGGYMPADPAALAAVGHTLGEGYSNSAVLQHVEVQPLTDIFALPHWLPFTNVFSVGDVLIGVGVAWLVVATMRRDPGVPATGDHSAPTTATARGARTGGESGPVTSMREPLA